jgi:hypothetical protein
MAVLVTIWLRRWPPPWSSRAYSILSVGWAMGRPTRERRLRDDASVRGAFSGRGVFHLSEQGQQREGEATQALLGGVVQQH